MFFTGLASGFGKELAASRQQEADKAERDSQREDAILQHLTTSDDPEIASMALSGILTRGAGKPQKGLKGFLGEMQGNPMLPRIRDLISKGRQVPNAGPAEPNAPPEGEVPASLAAPPEAGGAALPAGSPVEQGSAPMKPAAVPPPGPVQFHEGASTGFHTEPRTAFMLPADKIAAVEQAKIGGEYKAKIQAFMDTQRIPGASQAIFGHPGATHSATDDSGNVTVYDASGNQINYIPSAGKSKTEPKPPAAETQLQMRAREIRAANPAITEEAATQQALTEGRTATTTKAGTAAAGLATAQAGAAVAPQMNAARLESLRVNAMRAWQQVNGTVPMNDNQAWTAARTTLGNDASPNQVREMHDNLLANRPFAGGAGSAGGAAPVGTPPPPAPSAAAVARIQTPSRIAPTTPPPAARPSVIPAGIGDQPRVPRYYSAQGKRTIQSIETARPMLQKLVAAIQAEGLQDSNEALGTGAAKRLQAWGISPGALDTEIMQLSSVAEAAGFSTMSVGRMNIPMMDVLKGHLTDAGDSYKLLYDKAQGMLDKFPDIAKAVDTAESKTINRRGGSAGSPPLQQPASPVYAWDPQGIRHVQTDPNATLPAGWTTTPPRK